MNTDTAALSLALLLAGSMLVPDCDSKPVPQLRIVWKNPCGLNNGNTESKVITNHQGRHPATKTMRSLKTQVANAKSHYQKELNKIKSIYERAGKEMRIENYNYVWLAKNQLQWYKENVQCTGPNEKVSAVLKKLHTALQNFSVTFEAMRIYGKTHVAPEGVMERRDNLLKEMSQQLKMVLCEAETALHNMGLPVPELAKPEILSEDKWEMRPDYTGTLTRDWGVIIIYHKFLDDWSRIMKMAVQKKAQAGCKGSKSAQYHPRSKKLRESSHKSIKSAPS